MNWRRGLFRLWLLATILWVAFVIKIQTPSITNPYLPRLYYTYFDNVHSLLPTIGGGVKETVDGYYSIDFPNYITVYTPPTIPPTEANKRMLEPHVDLIDRSQEIWEGRLTDLWGTAELAAGPPGALFILGNAIIWALSGFRRDKGTGTDG